MRRMRKREVFDERLQPRQPPHLRGLVRSPVGHPPAPPRRSAQAPRQRQDDLAGLAAPVARQAELAPHTRTHRAPQSLAGARPAFRHRAVGAPEPPAQDRPRRRPDDARRSGQVRGTAPLRDPGALAIEGMATVTDEIIDLHDRILGKLFNAAKHKHQQQFQASGKAINAKVRLATSIKQGTVTASLMLRKLGSYPRQNGLAVALRELGRIERTLFILDWLQSVELRRRVHAGLNKGEARNALARAVFFNRLGEIRDRSFEQQRYRASGLNLVTAAIVLWNTVYLERASNALRGHGQTVDDALLQYLSPLGWEHINLTGDYLWRSSAKIGAGKFRPLRPLQPA
ncbi:Tn3 transposase DDE-like domain protein [Bordetella bronchiseptica 00-P-2730]|nr:Transposase Tn3 [Pseudomonas aeruginosa 2192]KCV36181.1 Tn3 transposase DDE-like domain protein [Bordetella bronchiseptica 00-P-2730]SMZ50207.1 TnpA transposase [Pseudomonas aeruginosa C-NN2]